MQNLSQIFIPKNAGTSITQIAEDLYGYYEQVEDRIIEVASEKELIAFLTPEICQKYVDRIYDEVDEEEGEAAVLERLSQIEFDTLVEMGMIEGDE